MSVKLYVFCYSIKNFFKIIKKRKLKKSRQAKKMLKEIFRENTFDNIPQALQQKGFYKIDKRKKMNIDEIMKGTMLAGVDKKSGSGALELSLFEDVEGFEDCQIVLFVAGIVKSGQTEDVFLFDTFISKPFLEEREGVEEAAEIKLEYDLQET